MESLDEYLDDIGRAPLLSAEEEASLSRALRSPQTPLQDAVRARERLIVSNLRLVVHVAGRHRNSGLPLEDLVSEGNLGLLDAVRRFDPDRGFRFATYAVWWIDQAIWKAIYTKVRMIKLSRDQELKVRQWKRTGVAFEGDVFRDARFAAVSVESLDVRRHAVGRKPQERQDDVDRLLEPLDDREATVIRLRYGLYDGKPITLREIGRMLAVTGQMVSLIEKKAIAKIRARRVYLHACGEDA